MTWLVIPSFCNFVPIFLVLYTHFRNVQTISKILSSWGSQRTNSNFEEQFDIDFMRTVDTADVALLLPVSPRTNSTSKNSVVQLQESGVSLQNTTPPDSPRPSDERQQLVEEAMINFISHISSEDKTEDLRRSLGLGPAYNSFR